MVVVVEDLGDDDPREDIGDGAYPRAAFRDADHSQQGDHPEAGERPVHQRKDAKGERKGDEGEERTDRVERSCVRIGEQRTSPGYPGVPDRETAVRVGVVNHRLDRQAVTEQIAAAEIPPEKERVGVNREDEQEKKTTQSEGRRASARRTRPGSQACAGPVMASADQCRRLSQDVRRSRFLL
jgi:hypothetical protein